VTDDLLKLSRIEAGRFKPELRRLSVAEIIGPCVETARGVAGLKYLLLDSDCEDGLTLTGDLNALQEIVQNLLDNAVRYTPPGGSVSVRAFSGDGGVVISVSDTGIGIPRSEQERIFERFYRVDAARSRELGGTGLGLSIARHLADAHGGRIEVASEVGRGSTFSVFLPVTPPPFE
jgi:signal transduction histidine kinase